MRSLNSKIFNLFMVLKRVLKDNHDAWSINYSLFSLKRRRKKRKKHEFLELEIKGNI